jgi:hypothetical protein
VVSDDEALPDSVVTASGDTGVGVRGIGSPAGGRDPDPDLFEA